MCITLSPRWGANFHTVALRIQGLELSDEPSTLPNGNNGVFLQDSSLPNNAGVLLIVITREKETYFRVSW